MKPLYSILVDSVKEWEFVFRLNIAEDRQFMSTMTKAELWQVVKKAKTNPVGVVHVYQNGFKLTSCKPGFFTLAHWPVLTFDEWDKLPEDEILKQSPGK